MAIQKQPIPNIAQEIIDLVGGESNIINLTHCTTRLRFRLKRTPTEHIHLIESMPDVISVMESGGQFQIVIGYQVEKVYEQIDKLIAPNELINTQYSLSGIIDTIIEIFTPMIWLMSVGGISKGLMSLLAILDLVNPDSGTYRILFSAADSIFFFLPLFLGYTAAKKFGSNPFLGMATGGALVHPEIISHMHLIFSQQIPTTVSSESFMFFPIQYLDYARSVLPIIFATWFNSKLENLFPQSLPGLIDKILSPFLCLVITVPITILVVGPTVTWFSTSILYTTLALYDINAILTGVLVGFLWPGMVIFGIHWCLFPMALNNIGVDGYDAILPLFVPAFFGQAGACLGIFLKNKDLATRGQISPAALSAMFGISEPAIYGVTLKKKWPFIFGCISSALGGAIVAHYNTSFNFHALLKVLSFGKTIQPQGTYDSVAAFVIAIILTIITATLMTYFWSKTSDNVTQKLDNNVNSPLANNKGESHQDLIIYSPLSGEIIPLTMVSDPTFASELIGKGIAIRPNNGDLFSPFDGTVTSIFNAHHAIGIKSQSGIELIVHIGLDTVKLKGKYFSPSVKQGDVVKTGDLLIRFDIAKIMALGFDITTPILVTNSDEYNEFICSNISTIAKGEPLISIRPKENVNISNTYSD